MSAAAKPANADRKGRADAPTSKVVELRDEALLDMRPVSIQSLA